jgi:hypothetical protein
MAAPMAALAAAGVPAVLAVTTAFAIPAQPVPPTPVTVRDVIVPEPNVHYRVAAATTPRIPPLVGANGLTPRAAALAAYIQHKYPTVRTIGGVRPCDSYAEHCRGVALDVMVGKDTALGDRIALDVLGRDDVQFVLWRETYRKPNGISRWMTDRGTPTANHYDHLHVRVVGS